MDALGAGVVDQEPAEAALDAHVLVELVGVAVGDVLEEIQLSGVTKEQLEMFSWVTLPQLHTEIYDIVKRKTVDEQFDIFDKFEVSGPNIPYKHNVECFFITVLYLTETEMRKRGLEIPENPPLHTATA